MLTVARLGKLGQHYSAQRIDVLDLRSFGGAVDTVCALSEEPPYNYIHRCEEFQKCYRSRHRLLSCIGHILHRRRYRGIGRPVIGHENFGGLVQLQHAPRS